MLASLLQHGPCGHYPGEMGAQRLGDRIANYVQSLTMQAILRVSTYTSTAAARFRPGIRITYPRETSLSSARWQRVRSARKNLLCPNQRDERRQNCQCVSIGGATTRGRNLAICRNWGADTHGLPSSCGGGNKATRSAARLATPCYVLAASFCPDTSTSR